MTIDEMLLGLWRLMMARQGKESFFFFTFDVLKHRDLGEFHKKEMRKIAEFKYLNPPDKGEGQ